MKRVVVVGPESTGKTTLAQRLAEHYKTVWVPEYVREFVDKKGAPVEYSDVAEIVKGHIELERSYIPKANRILICDTDTLMSLIYSELYYGKFPPQVIRLAEKRIADHYLLADADVPWVPDPQRDMPHRREEIRDRVAALLTKYKASFTLIKGDWEARFRLACAAIDRLL